MKYDDLKGRIGDGKFITVVFRKRTTGEVRKMRCRTGVSKHLKGGTQSYDPQSKGLLTVYDIDKKGYRNIPADSIIEIREHGKVNIDKQTHDEILNKLELLNDTLTAAFHDGVVDRQLQALRAVGGVVEDYLKENE